MPKSNGCTQLQRQFAHLVVQQRMTLKEAYVAAGYKKPKTDKEWDKRASELRHKPVVAALIDQLNAAVTDAVVEATSIDAAWVVKQLCRNHEDARKVENFCQSNRALELIGEHLGMWGKAKAPPQRGTVDLTEYTDEDLVDVIRSANASARREGAARPPKGTTKH